MAQLGNGTPSCSLRVRSWQLQAWQLCHIWWCALGLSNPALRVSWSLALADITCSGHEHMGHRFPCCRTWSLRMERRLPTPLDLERKRLKAALNSAGSIAWEGISVPPPPFRWDKVGKGYWAIHFPPLRRGLCAVLDNYSFPPT